MPHAMPGTPFVLRPCFGLPAGVFRPGDFFEPQLSLFGGTPRSPPSAAACGMRFIAHDADVPGSRMFPDFSIIKRYQRSTPIIAKCENNREPGTAARCKPAGFGLQTMRKLRKLRKIQRRAGFLHFLQFLQADGGWARPDARNRASAL
jgi:hypothetical protein